MKLSNKLKIGFEKIVALFFSFFNKNKYVIPAVILDTSLYSDNAGDQIIGFYCRKRLKELNISYNLEIPTHALPKKDELKKVSASQIKILLGTNIISPKIERIYLWRFPKRRSYYKNILFFGVGWNGVNRDFSLYSKMLFKNLFTKHFNHSIRDSFTVKKLNDIGIHNVINTGCPTMWDLTPSFCKKIPTNKHNNVVTTITDYLTDETNDRIMFEILLKCYKKVYVWLQGDLDYPYIYKLLNGNISNLCFVDQGLNNYNDLLKNEDLDYVGTRLHAGIHALNLLHRSIIISIDNRALEISKDTNLPIVERNCVGDILEATINSEIVTDIRINEENIVAWKNQFNKKGR